ncbi:MAG: haloacid dehalogenase type II [Candidatus Methylomirabilales bacterium]
MTCRAVTLDVYAALFDTPGSLAGVLEELFRRRGVTEDRHLVAQTWRQKHREYLLVANSLSREPASNRQAIEASARYVLRRLTPPLTAEEVQTLVGAWEHLRPWPEVAGVLQAIRARPLALAALSNGDREMLRTLLTALPVPFDHIVSTEGGQFKPHPSVYRKALDILGVRAEELLHVAGAATDAMGATAVGIRTVWVNRSRDVAMDTRLTPTHEVPDLRGVLHFIDAS